MVKGFLPKSPKARLVLAVLVLALIGGGIYWWFFSKKPANPLEERKIVAGALKLREDQLKKLNLDNDKDGLRDWEETIFRTDSNNPDTDGDGTKDGDEVIQGRDPALKGPNDKIAPKEAEKKNTPALPNITSEFSQKFLREPIAQIISGSKPSIDPQAVEAYTDRLLNKSILSSAPQIKATEIRVGSDDSIKAIGEYFKSFSAIFLNLNARGENEIDIVVKAFEEQAYEKLGALSGYVGAYEKVITQMKALPVPPSIQDFHLGILNYLAKFKLSVEFMRNAESDPIQAILAINERVRLNQEFQAYLNHFDASVTAVLNSKTK